MSQGFVQSGSRKIASKELIDKAIKDIQKNKISIRKAAKKYSICNTTLQGHISGKYKGYATSFGPTPRLFPAEQDFLYRLLTLTSDKGYMLTRKEMRGYAELIIKNSGRELKIDILSSQFIRTFLKKHYNLQVCSTKSDLQKSSSKKRIDKSQMLELFTELQQY